MFRSQVDDCEYHDLITARLTQNEYVLYVEWNFLEI